ncbi:MAG: hypothetical protein E6K70_22655, partial [Planctomycetota bacterium]
MLFEQAFPARGRLFLAARLAQLAAQAGTLRLELPGSTLMSGCYLLMPAAQCVALLTQGGCLAIETLDLARQGQAFLIPLLAGSNC